MNSSTLRRSATALFAAALLTPLAACGAAEKTTSAPGNTEVAKGGDSFGGADRATQQLGSDAAPGQFPRTVKHANGTTEIKDKPQRVVVLDTGDVDALVSLGLKPVGLATTKGKGPVPDYLVPHTQGVTQVGDINNINLEAVAALKPDLIIGSKLRQDKLYPQLSQIAPTVFSIRPGYTWKENFALTADATGDEEKATAVMADYDRQVADLKKSLNGTDKTVSLVRFMPGKLRLYGNKSLIGTILQDAGLKRPTIQDVDDLAVEISPENISQGDGDLLFYSSYGDPAATGEKAVTDGAAWRAIPAVREGRSRAVNDDTWFLGLGPTGAGLIVADLKQFVK